MPNITSPCIRNCCLNDDDICLGCFRSIEEIMQWSSATDQEKQSILDLSNTRKHQHQHQHQNKYDSNTDD